MELTVRLRVDKSSLAMRRRQIPELRTSGSLRARARTLRPGVALLLSFLAVIIALTTVFGANGVLHMLQLRRQHQVLSERAFLAVGQSKRLRRRIVRLRQDDAYLEAVAREKLGFVRDREVVYRFPGPARPAAGR
jgi:cell division protein FtsB